ncbi:MAG: 50S ribosomal protein L25 [Verrucomicrobia bacterium]|nr:50S ribosomal protein L25 [Verrucomicrobiota bacterium]MBU1909469.1 50S ribosomal protein L25 [Verrucomicrobiota bacterium]
MKTLKVSVQPRQARGSGQVGRLRREGLLPAVVYGAGKPVRTVQLNLHDFEQALRGHAGEHLLMDLEIQGETTLKVLLKEVQHHPVSGRMTHADFNEVSMTEKIRVELPLRLVGEPVGVTQMGGILEHLIRQVAVECLPADIVEHVDMDVSALNIGDSLTVADIKLDPARYAILTPMEVAVATVAAPRVEEEPVVAEAAVGEAAEGEPEVITEKKEEGEEGEEGEKGEEKEGKKAAGKKPEAKKEEGKKPEARKEEGRKAK